MTSLITVNKDLPTDDADVLAGTLLEQVPGRGVLNIFIASSQRDGQITVSGPNIPTGVYQAPPILRSNGIPDVQADIPVVVPVLGPGRVIINYNEVTAGDAFATVIFVPA